jgi:hypothetical protein
VQVGTGPNGRSSRLPGLPRPQRQPGSSPCGDAALDIRGEPGLRGGARRDSAAAPRPAHKRDGTVAIEVAQLGGELSERYVPRAPYAGLAQLGGFADVDQLKLAAGQCGRGVARVRRLKFMS